jgi:hypothetical protein
MHVLLLSNCNARQAKVFHLRHIIVADFRPFADIAVGETRCGKSAPISLEDLSCDLTDAGPSIAHI